MLPSLEIGPDQATLFPDLAIVLKDRFDLSGQLVDLDDAIEIHRKLVLLQPEDDSKLDSLSHLGIALHSRFHHSNNLPDLTEAIFQHREALSLVPAPLHSRLNHLSKALRCRFDQTGQLSDVDEAISLRSEAVTLTKLNYNIIKSLAEDSMARYAYSMEVLMSKEPCH